LNKATEGLDLIKLERAFQSNTVLRMSACSSQFDIVDSRCVESYSA